MNKEQNYIDSNLESLAQRNNKSLVKAGRMVLIEEVRVDKI